jgi:catechol 2,3-dioxygenase-like lactoylglutathione lyase family enzyme
MFNDVDHISLTVSDLKRSLEFYNGLLGFPITWEAVITDPWIGNLVGYPGAIFNLAYVEGGGEAIELVEYGTPKGKPMDRKPWDIGSPHIAFMVEDCWARYNDLKAKGVPFVSEPQAIIVDGQNLGWCVYMKDPDGITIELSEIFSKKEQK